jgi:hypothetical protein
MLNKKIGSKLITFTVITLFLLSSFTLALAAATTYYSVTFNQSTGGFIYWKYGTNTNFNLPNPDQIYSAGTYALPAGPIMIDAKPASGYIFDHFHYTAGATVGDTSVNPFGVAVSGAFTITAYFVPSVTTHQVTFAETNGGTIKWNLNGNEYNSGTVTLDNGSFVTISAYPNANYQFRDFTISGNSNSSSNPLTQTIIGDITYTAYFDSSTYGTANVVLGNSTGGFSHVYVDNGLGAGTGTFPDNSTYSVATGANLTFTAFPDMEDTFVGWNTSIGFISATNPFTIQLTNNLTVTPEFLWVLPTPTPIMPTATPPVGGGLPGTGPLVWLVAQLTAFRIDGLSLALCICGSIVTFLAAYLLLRNLKLWMLGLITLIAGFAISIYGEPSILGLAIWFIVLAGTALWVMIGGKGHTSGK